MSAQNNLFPLVYELFPTVTHSHVQRCSLVLMHKYASCLWITNLAALTAMIVFIDFVITIFSVYSV